MGKLVTWAVKIIVPWCKQKLSLMSMNTESQEYASGGWHNDSVVKAFAA